MRKGNFILAAAILPLLAVSCKNNATTQECQMCENRDNITGQMDLFGGGEESGEERDGIAIPDMDDYTRREKMTMEKEMTGLYLSGHPMDE